MRYSLIAGVLSSEWAVQLVWCNMIRVLKEKVALVV